MVFHTEFHPKLETVKAVQYVEDVEDVDRPEYMTAETLIAAVVLIERRDDVLWLYVARDQDYTAIYPGDWIVEESDESGFYSYKPAEFESRYNVDRPEG